MFHSHLVRPLSNRLEAVLQLLYGAYYQELLHEGYHLAIAASQQSETLVTPDAPSAAEMKGNARRPGSRRR